MISAEQMDSDVIAMAPADGEDGADLLLRGGKLIGGEYFILEGTEGEDNPENVPSSSSSSTPMRRWCPPEVLLPNEVEEAQIIQQWLRGRRGGQKVELVVPREGTPQELVQMATENAVETLRALRSQWETDTHRQSEALAELQQALNLPDAPNRIECYDIPHAVDGAVGSMVVFEQGVPSKKLYRRFNIRSVVGPDDFASMEEVLMRRFRRWQGAQEAHALGEKPDPAFALLPDLLIVDGGKGQLSRAVTVLEHFDLLGKVPVAGLAKQEEELFLPGRSESLLLPRHSQALYLVQRVRDEAHRFAITATANAARGLACLHCWIPFRGLGRCGARRW